MASGGSSNQRPGTRNQGPNINDPPSALLAFVVFISIIVRVVHLVSIYPTPSFSYHRTFAVSDMYSFNEWAGRIVDGDVLGRQRYNPVRDWMVKNVPAGKWDEWFGTAPVFYKAPLYPYLIALLRWGFGDAMLPMALLQILVAAACAALLFVITEHAFGRTSAFLAALLFALYAPAVHYAVVLLRGPWIVLAALLISWQLIRLQRRPTSWGGGVLGFTVGLALVFHEGFATLPALTLAMIVWLVRDRRRVAVVAGTFALGCGLAFAPVIVRNLIVGVPPFQLAVTGAHVLATCNAGDTDPVFFQPPAPSFLPLMNASGGKLLNEIVPCLRTFGGVGAFLAFYLRRAAGLVVPFENPDNANFYYAALKSPLLGLLPTFALLFPIGVVGVALAGRRSKRLAPVLPALLALLVATAIQPPLSRYRTILVPFLLPFAGLALVQAARWVRARHVAPLAAAACGIVLVSVAMRLLERAVVFRGHEPTWIMYRPVEFNLAADAYAKQGRFQEATREFLQLAAHCRVPAEQANATIQAARLQIKAGDPAAARTFLQSASGLAPNNPGMLLAIGDAYWHLLGDAESARAAYRRSSDLAPTGKFGNTARARLRNLAAAPPAR
jgi:tetratricopeptide (TPR) repeat protein